MQKQGSPLLKKEGFLVFQDLSTCSDNPDLAEKVDALPPRGNAIRCAKSCGLARKDACGIVSPTRGTKVPPRSLKALSPPTQKRVPKAPLRWRREWDSNPRFLAESLVFKTSSLNHSDISPYITYIIYLNESSAISSACLSAAAFKVALFSFKRSYCSI